MRIKFLVISLLMLAGCGETVVPTATTSGSPDPSPVENTHTTEIENFLGDWAYAQSCEWQHSASLQLTKENETVAGSWSDGQRSFGENGELRGELRDGKLFVRFCTESDDADQAGVCPNFGTESAYLVLDGQNIIWYRTFGKGYEKYLVMHKIVDGKDIPVDDNCP